MSIIFIFCESFITQNFSLYEFTLVTKNTPNNTIYGAEEVKSLNESFNGIAYKISL